MTALWGNDLENLAPVYKTAPMPPDLRSDPDLSPPDDLDEVERRLDAMSVGEAMTTQRSIRRIHPDPVAPGIVRRLIELGMEGPTGSNAQSWEFIVINGEDRKARFAEQYRRAWKLYGGLGKRLRTDEQTQRIMRAVQWQVDRFEQVPVLVVPCLHTSTRPPLVPMPAIADSSHYGSIYPSVQNILLGARAIGLGASLVTLPLWSGIVSRRILGLPLNVEPTCVICLGWPIGHYGPKARKSVDDVLHLETWKGK